MSHRSNIDVELLRAVRAGEPGAFELFVEEYGPMIHRFGVRQCGPNADAEDVYQETLIKVFQRLAELRNPAALRSWLFRVVATECLMTRRKHPPQRELELSEDRWRDVDLRVHSAWSELPAQAAERADFRRQLAGGVAALSESERIVFLLRDVEGLSTTAAAEALGLGRSAIKMRLSRARKSLRRDLANWL